MSEGPANEDGLLQDEIIITGRAQRLYRVGETDTGKLPTDPLSSPISISTINADLIRDQGARDAQDIYRNIAGVSVFSYAGV
ncbi:MAG: TonB-dependent receptor plug domain-containing protein, partial [Pseudomonadota bacterium]